VSNDYRISDLFFLICAIVLKSAGNALGKMAGLQSAHQSVLTIVLNPFYIGMIVAYAVQAVCWVLTLRRIPLTRAYPFLSVSFLLDFCSAKLFFGETISALHWVGISIVVIGVGMIAAAPTPEEKGNAA